MEGRENQQVPSGRPTVDSNLPHWPALGSTGPYTMSLITLQEDTCNWTSSLFSEKAGSGPQNKGQVFAEHGHGRTHAANLGLGPCVDGLRTQGLGKHEHRAQRELNPHLSAQAAVSWDSH